MLTGRKLPFTLAFAVLVVLAFGASCKGFFVNPTLTSVAISPPTPTIANSQTQQFTAVGTFNDGSSGSTPVTWTSSEPTTVASINSSSGLATAIGVGTTTITATSTKLPSISGTTTLTVVPANVTSITVSPSSTTTQTGHTFELKAVDQTGTNDISASVTWTFTVQGTSTKETGMTLGTPDSGGQPFTVGTLTPTVNFPVTLSVVATLTTSSGTVTSNTVTVTITS